MENTANNLKVSQEQMIKYTGEIIDLGIEMGLGKDEILERRNELAQILLERKTREAEAFSRMVWRNRYEIFSDLFKK